MPSITNNSLVFYNKLSYPYTSVCLVILLINGLFNLRMDSNYHNNPHKLDKAVGLEKGHIPHVITH